MTQSDHTDTQSRSFRRVVLIIFLFLVISLTLALTSEETYGWLFAGHILFGLTVGLMIGMTQSKVVSDTLPLLFTFAGGSIVALSIGHTDEQLTALGKQLAGFGIGMIVGLLVGIFLQKLEVSLPFGKMRKTSLDAERPQAAQQPDAAADSRI